MNTGKTLQISLDDVEQTTLLASKLAANIKGGEVIEFASDLGGGKTTFIRSLVAALGSHDHVSSPTFTVSKEYTANDIIVRHYDFYRLPDPGIVAEMLAETLDSKQTLTLIEWGGAVKDVLPEKRLLVQIAKDPENEDRRHFTFQCPSTVSYLLKGLL
jgi:tRNA threonylcarbamoyladenosine biosynthesis protein TsaE